MKYNTHFFPNRDLTGYGLGFLRNRDPRVMGSFDCLPLTEKACQSTTPSNVSIMGQVFVSILTRKASRGPTLCDH